MICKANGVRPVRAQSWLAQSWSAQSWSAQSWPALAALSAAEVVGFFWASLPGRRP